MTPEELTTIVTAHQAAISRHDTEMAEIRAILANAAQQTTDLAQQTTDLAQQQAQIARQQVQNQEAIAHLTASIQELRNLVADYIQSRDRP